MPSKAVVNGAIFCARFGSRKHHTSTGACRGSDTNTGIPRRRLRNVLFRRQSRNAGSVGLRSHSIIFSTKTPFLLALPGTVRKPRPIVCGRPMGFVWLRTGRVLSALRILMKPGFFTHIVHLIL